jgi:ribosomal subunit interface protein
MTSPLQVTFRDIDPSTAIDEYIRKRATKLDTFFDRIQRCHVVVEAPHRHHQHGKRYRARIDIAVPGDELVVTRNPENLVHEDMYACIDDAFDSAQRMLQDYARRRRGDVKHHASDQPDAAGTLVSGEEG